ITAEEVTQMISNQIKLNIIDLRNPAEFSAEHIIGSVNPSDEELASILAEVDKSQVYILVERAGNQVGKNLIKEMGYPAFFLYLEGGFDNWKKSAYPTLSSGDVDSFVDQSKVKHISVEDFKKLKESRSPFFLIDLRAKEQYEKEKLEGSSNFPLEELEKRRFEIPSSRTIILYGENALDSFQGAVRLFDLGFFNVRTFKENFSTLKSQGL
ncbi:MAG: rhodanese-like domain-containing protein, partial [Patescibacteria group bacterium]